jgi:hypothetical protein
VEALGRRAGLEARGARLGALIFALTPGLHLSATSCLNDVPAAALILATAALVQARASLPILAMAAGLGLGTKATVAYAIPGILLLAFLVRREPAAPAGSRTCAWTLAAMGLLAGVFWYVRNAVWFGNPVFPVGEPGYDASAVAVQMGPRWSSMLANARDLLDYRIYDQQTALGANVDDMAGWGAVVFSCGLPGLAPILLRSPRLRPLAAGFLVSLASSLALIVHDPWCLKYVFFFPALGALAAAAVAGLHRNLRVVVLAGLGFCFLGTFLPYDLPFPQFRALAGQGWRERTALPNPALIRGVDRVACFGGYRTRSALLYGPDYGRQVVYLRAQEPEAFWRALEESGAEILYGVPQDSRQGALLEKGLQRGALRDLGDSFYRVVRR